MVLLLISVKNFPKNFPEEYKILANENIAIYNLITNLGGRLNEF